MLILYAAAKYDYGKPEQGYSFEHYNFYDSLLHMGNDIIYFDSLTLLQQYGRDRMNSRLLEVVRAEKPDLLFCFLFRDELDQSAIREVSENSATVTFNWFADDHWRFDNFSCHWAPCFNWVSTTAASALPKYAALGYRNVIKSQWACNQFLYRKLDLPLEHDVTFVGQPHSNRPAIIKALREAGIPVQVWGSGWESGRLSQEEMIRVFNQSRINLNLSNASTPATVPGGSPLARLRHLAGRSLDKAPFGRQLRLAAKTQLGAIRESRSPGGAKNTGSDGPRLSEQIKGRNFEVPGCGGFMLTGRAENMDDYYENNREIVCFDDTNDLLAKVRYYLSHDEEREAIARAGHERTLREHTYVHRLSEIFSRMGLPWEASDEVLAGKRPGHTEEVR